MLAFLVLPMALVEFYLGSQNPESVVVYEPEGANYRTSDILGYAPRPDSLISAKRYYDDELVYDVEYGINSTGLRSTPANRDTASEVCVFFFGGSFTFGEGLNDSDTVANYVAIAINGKAKVYNFGYSGYGPHQMLAALESGWVKKITRPCKQVTAIYTGVTQHVARVSGYSWWDLHGPSYTLGHNGKPQFSGAFDDGAKKAVLRLRAVALKSNIFNLLFSMRLNGYYSDAAVQIYASVVAAAPDALREHFGENSKFMALLWHPDFFNESLQGYVEALAALDKKNIQTYSVNTSVLPDSDIGGYKIHPHEGHPNAKANRLVADFVVANMLGPVNTNADRRVAAQNVAGQGARREVW